MTFLLHTIHIYIYICIYTHCSFLFLKKLHIFFTDRIYTFVWSIVFNPIIYISNGSPTWGLPKKCLTVDFFLHPATKLQFFYVDTRRTNFNLLNWKSIYRYKIYVCTNNIEKWIVLRTLLLSLLCPLFYLLLLFLFRYYYINHRRRWW